MSFTETLLPLELDPGESVTCRLSDGKTFRMQLKETGARILYTTLETPKVETANTRTYFAFHCLVDINGETHRLEREVPTWRSFYEPWQIAGVHIWFDAVADIFDFLTETHGACAPTKTARFAIQEAGRRICPEPLLPWCPLPEDGLRIDQCYNGEDCWLGPYFGCAAHGGLDINHRRGTPIWAPIAIDHQYLFNSIAKGDNNNRWRGHRTWPDGSEWILQCHHLSRLTVEENTPVAAGKHYAVGAGINSGAHDHSHFAFKIQRDGQFYLLDPWILFWQMYADRRSGLVHWPDAARRTDSGFLPEIPEGSLLQSL